MTFPDTCCARLSSVNVGYLLKNDREQSVRENFLRMWEDKIEGANPPKKGENNRFGKILELGAGEPPPFESPAYGPVMWCVNIFLSDCITGNVS